MVFYPALRATELLAALVAGRLKLFPTPLAFVLCSHSLYPPFFFIPPSLYRLLLFLRRFGSIFRLQLCLRQSLLFPQAFDGGAGDIVVHGGSPPFLWQ